MKYILPIRLEKKLIPSYTKGVVKLHLYDSTIKMNNRHTKMWNEIETDYKTVCTI